MISKLTHEHIIALLITLDKEIEDSGLPETVKTITPKPVQHSNDFDAPTFLRGGFDTPAPPRPTSRATRRIELLREIQEYINERLSKISFGLDIDSPKEGINATD